MVKEGILGYVQTSPTGSNQRLHQYIYGGDTVFRLTANPADVGSYLPIYAEPKSDPNFHFNPGTWYQNAYQNDGYISSVPVDGTTPLYSVYNGNAVGGRSLGDYLTTPSEYEIISGFMLRAVTAATQTVGGVGMGRAVIDGVDHAVLQWPQQEAGVGSTSRPRPAFLAARRRPTCSVKAMGARSSRGARRCRASCWMG